MNNKLAKLAVSLLFLVFLPTQVKAAGIELQEQSATAMGRVLAVRALLNDPSTVFFNPAGLAWLEDGFKIAVGDTMVFPHFTYSDPRDLPADQLRGDSKTVNPLVPPPHAYASYTLTLKGDQKLGFGAGFNYPFGLTIQWDDEFAGKYLAAESALMIPEITLGVSYSPLKQVSIGAAFVMSPSHVYMKRFMGPEFGLVGDDGNPIDDAFVEMAGDGWGFGYNVGIQVRPIDKLYFGATYRSPINIEMTGDAHFNLPGLEDRSAFPDQAVKTAFQLPDIVAVGVGYQILPKWFSEFDFEYTFADKFKSIPLTFPDDTSGALSQEIAQDWENAYVLRWGNEVYVSKSFTMRAGIGFDKTPATDENLSPMLPDSDRIFGSVGAGYRFPFGLSLDAACQLTIFKERTVTGQACTETSTDPACFNESGDFVAYDENGAENWSGNRFPATYKTFAVLVAITAKMEF